MRPHSLLAFVLAATIHALVVVVGIGLTLLAQRNNVIDPVVFDLVDVDDLEIGDHFEMPGPPSPTPGVKFVRPRTKLIKVPPAPQNAPETTKSGAAAKPVPPKNRTVTYEQFRKQNQAQLEKNQKPAGGRRSTTAPGIDASGIVKELQDYGRGPKGSGGTGGTRAMTTALNAYWVRLIRALTAAYEQPDSVDQLYVARVSFFIGPDGSISAVRVVKTSGNPEYDQAVVEAFRRVRSIGAVPGGRSGTFEFDFKMIE